MSLEAPLEQTVACPLCPLLFIGNPWLGTQHTPGEPLVGRP